MNGKEPQHLSLNEFEEIEKLTLRWIFQAIIDFGMEAHDIFLKSPDRVEDIAEDITRELLDRLSGFNLSRRIYGTVDYKKARYVILPEQTVKQALFIDSKAEKENKSATIQLSQTSMWVRQKRSNEEIDEKGFLLEISEYDNVSFLTTTALIHYKYSDIEDIHHLEEINVAIIPNGLLQDRYNPTSNDNIWLAGRNAPTRGEDFRVRLSFAKLKRKANWRVQKVYYNEPIMKCIGRWET